MIEWVHNGEVMDRKIGIIRIGEMIGLQIYKQVGDDFHKWSQICFLKKGLVDVGWVGRLLGMPMGEC